MEHASAEPVPAAAMPNDQTITASEEEPPSATTTACEQAGRGAEITSAHSTEDKPPNNSYSNNQNAVTGNNGQNLDGNDYAEVQQHGDKSLAASASASTFAATDGSVPHSTISPLSRRQQKGREEEGNEQQQEQSTTTMHQQQQQLGEVAEPAQRTTKKPPPQVHISGLPSIARQEEVREEEQSTAIMERQHVKESSSPTLEASSLRDDADKKPQPRACSNRSEEREEGSDHSASQVQDTERKPPPRACGTRNEEEEEEKEASELEVSQQHHAQKKPPPRACITRDEAEAIQSAEWQDADRKPPPRPGTYNSAHGGGNHYVNAGENSAHLSSPSSAATSSALSFHSTNRIEPVMAVATVLDVQPTFVDEDHHTMDAAASRDRKYDSDLPILRAVPVSEQRIHDEAHQQVVVVVEHENITNHSSDPQPELAGNNNHVDQARPDIEYSAQNSNDYDTASHTTYNSNIYSDTNEVNAPMNAPAPLRVYYDEAPNNENETAPRSGSTLVDKPVVISCSMFQLFGCLFVVIVIVIAVTVSVIAAKTDKGDPALLRRRVHFGMQWGITVAGCEMQALETPIQMQCLYSERLVVLSSWNADCDINGTTKMKCLAGNVTDEVIPPVWEGDTEYDYGDNLTPAKYEATRAWVLVACDSTLHLESNSPTRNVVERAPLPDLDYKLELGDMRHDTQDFAICDHRWYSAPSGAKKTKQLFGGIHGTFASKGRFCFEKNNFSYFFSPCDSGLFLSFGNDHLPENFGGMSDNPQRTAFCGGREACSIFDDDCPVQPVGSTFPSDGSSNNTTTIAIPPSCEGITCGQDPFELTPYLDSGDDDCAAFVTSDGEYVDDDDGLWSLDFIRRVFEPRIVQTEDYLQAVNYQILDDFDWSR